MDTAAKLPIRACTDTELTLQYSHTGGAGMEKRLETLKKRIDELLEQKEQVILAIDGKCTSGKTTLAGKLAQIYDCNVFHMDDFFLRPQQRTPERYAEPGGNVDYERFNEEVLLPLKAARPFSYRPFRCATFTLGDPVDVRPQKLNIVEGTYSLHPYFGAPYDLMIFSDILESFIFSIFSRFILL